MPSPRAHHFARHPAGPPPVFIGFGSLVMDKPEQLSKRIVDAVTETGLRAIIQRGWGKLGSHLKPEEVPKEVGGGGRDSQASTTHQWVRQGNLPCHGANFRQQPPA